MFNKLNASRELCKEFIEKVKMVRIRRTEEIMILFDVIANVLVRKPLKLLRKWFEEIGIEH